MNINDPNTSRTLAILIQPVPVERRRDFIRGAEKAKDMESFIETLKQYDDD